VDSAFASDIPFLRSHNFDDSFTVRLLKVCGQDTGSYMSLEGIQVVLGDGVDKRWAMT
jgi:hypothetical protein